MSFELDKLIYSLDASDKVNDLVLLGCMKSIPDKKYTENILLNNSNCSFFVLNKCSYVYVNLQCVIMHIKETRPVYVRPSHCSIHHISVISPDTHLISYGQRHYWFFRQYKWPRNSTHCKTTHIMNGI